VSYNPSQFAEKFFLALESAAKDKPSGGLNGFELEWNLLDEEFRPLLTVGSGPSQQSFVDYLRSDCISSSLRGFSQLEIFHWMIEWATRPYYSPRGAVYEGRLMEAVLNNALQRAGQQFNKRLYYWHGNLLFPTTIDHGSIPGSWGIAKRRYLERCVDLYGNLLATAGTHSNLSLPDPLFAWDFMHLPEAQRVNHHLDEYKSEFYITSTRLMRAFAALFIALSASTPLQVQVHGERSVVTLTENDSVRNMTFPNPQSLDLPNLYRSYNDYLRLSYNLVRRGVRFGNNNWTPVRARSFAEPVERLIAFTSDQLHDLYARGLFSIGETQPPEDMAQQIEKQNLMARINLPMARVEVRTDDGGHPLEVDIANLTLKHLLLIRFYADPLFARSFLYDRKDIARARRNEQAAARDGLRSEIKNPFTGKPVQMREFLKWSMEEIRPLANALGYWNDLQPLVAMAEGGPNTAEKLRTRLQMEIGSRDEVPLSILRDLAQVRETQVKADAEKIAAEFAALGVDAGKLSEFLQRARDDARQTPQSPIQFWPHPHARIETSYPDKTSEIIDLSMQLIRAPSVTTGAVERLDEIYRLGTFIFDYLRNYGLEVRFFNQSRYPALLVSYPGQADAPAMLSGHIDVVPPDPDDTQFEPRLEGDYLWGRGAADMKTVVATNLVWFKDRLLQGPPYPPINMLLVGNEENGETEPMGTPHVLKLLKQERGYEPRLLVAGERTGEKGQERFGEICTQNRGVMRFEVAGSGHRGHSGTASQGISLSEHLLLARQAIHDILSRHLTVSSTDKWQSQVTFPFIQIGERGIYNITPDHGVFGVEVRPIPQDNLANLLAELKACCAENQLELSIHVMENGIACDPFNPILQALMQAFQQISGQEPILGRKLPATSARFAPAGRGIVWGQSGLEPHAKDERHYIPSILPYYQTLQIWGDLLCSLI